MVISSPLRSDAVKLMSSTSFSITVCKRRAPMFSTPLVDLSGQVGNFTNGVIGEVERYFFDGH